MKIYRTSKLPRFYFKDVDLTSIKEHCVIVWDEDEGDDDVGLVMEGKLVSIGPRVYVYMYKSYIA